MCSIGSGATICTIVGWDEGDLIFCRKAIIRVTGDNVATIATITMTETIPEEILLKNFGIRKPSKIGNPVQACNKALLPWQACNQFKMDLFPLALCAQNALETKNRERPNKSPRTDKKNPAADVQAELLFHGSNLRKMLQIKP